MYVHTYVCIYTYIYNLIYFSIFPYEKIRLFFAAGENSSSIGKVEIVLVE